MLVFSYLYAHECSLMSIFFACLDFIAHPVYLSHFEPSQPFGEGKMEDKKKHPPTWLISRSQVVLMSQFKSITAYLYVYLSLTI